MHRSIATTLIEMMKRSPKMVLVTFDRQSGGGTEAYSCIIRYLESLPRTRDTTSAHAR